jgi:hypothetical protein
MANDQASDYLENQLINHVLRNVTYTPATTCAVALFTVTPSDVAASGAEVTSASGSYLRLSASFGPALTGSTANTNVLTFGPSTLPWGTITAFAIFDNITSGSGNMLIWSPLTSPVIVNQGDSAQFASGSLQISIA